MKDEDFEELCESVRQAGKMLRRKRLHLKDAIQVCRFCGVEGAYRMFLEAGPEDCACMKCMFAVIRPDPPKYYVITTRECADKMVAACPEDISHASWEEMEASRRQNPICPDVQRAENEGMPEGAPKP